MIYSYVMNWFDARLCSGTGVCNSSCEVTVYSYCSTLNVGCLLMNENLTPYNGSVPLHRNGLIYQISNFDGIISSVVPCSTPTPTPTPTVTITPTRVQTYSVGFYRSLLSPVNTPDTLLYMYRINGGSWTPIVFETILNGFNYNCSLKGTINNIPVGSNVQLGVVTQSSAKTIRYTAQTGSSCPGTAGTIYCLNTVQFGFVVNSNMNVAITVQTNGGAFDLC
jgi:hypothetical protein